MLVETHPKKVTTGLAIEVIIKGALLTILKVHPAKQVPPSRTEVISSTTSPVPHSS